MKRILLILLCCLVLSGCGREKNPYQVDTVIRIPVNPTDAPTEPAQTEATAASAETQEAVTEAPTEAAEPEETVKPTEGKSGSSGKKPTSTKKPSSTQKPASDDKQESTEPPATESEIQPPTEAVETVPATEPPYDPSDYSVGSLEYEILDALNAYRAEAGLGALSIDARLSGIAALRAEECSVSWSHNRPDGRGYTTAMSDYGYSFGASAQCLGHAGSSGSAALAAKWMDTDSKNAILNEDFDAAGIGVCRTGGVTIVAVLLVG